MRKQRLQKRKKGKGWSKDHRSNILGEILVFFCSGNYILCHLCLINTVYSVLSTEVSLYKSNCWTITRPMFIIECTDWIWARWDGEEPWAMGGIIHWRAHQPAALLLNPGFSGFTLLVEQMENAAIKLVSAYLIYCPRCSLLARQQIWPIHACAILWFFCFVGIRVYV